LFSFIAHIPTGDEKMYHYEACLLPTKTPSSIISAQEQYIGWLEKKLLSKKKSNRSSKIAVRLKPRPKLLLIDRVPKERHLIRAKIASLDLEVIEAFDNYIGLQLASSEQIDLIAIDISNYQDLITVSRLKKLPDRSEIPIIVTSFSNSKTLRDECLKRGCDLFLVKPIEPDYLVNNIEFFLNLNSLKEI